MWRENVAYKEKWQTHGPAMGASCSVEQQNFSELLRDSFITFKENFHFILRGEEECFCNSDLFQSLYTCELFTRPNQTRQDP